MVGSRWSLESSSAAQTALVLMMGMNGSRVMALMAFSASRRIIESGRSYFRMMG